MMMIGLGFKNAKLGMELVTFHCNFHESVLMKKMLNLNGKLITYSNVYAEIRCFAIVIILRFWRSIYKLKIKYISEF